MNVLHLSTYDATGGAARAANRINCGLNEAGINSKMLVQSKQSDDPSIITPYKSIVSRLYSRLRPKANKIILKLQNTDNQVYHSVNLLPSGIHRIVNSSNSDIVHLHWINDEMMSISEISKIKKPLVWTLHDMWAFAGSEHVVDLEYPNRYEEGYQSDNRPYSYSGLDIDKWTWKRKKKHWCNQGQEIYFVTPSSWLAKCLTKSKLFKGNQVTVIPNGLNTKIFKPTNKKIARESLSLPNDKKIVLFGAISSTSDILKGFNKLEQAKSYLFKRSDLKNLYFVVFGNEKAYVDNTNEFTTHFLGTIYNDSKLAKIYSAADVMLVPSLVESFGQTASESLACGTPVVAFNATGVKEIVDHKKNGYLAEPYNPRSIAKGIEWILSNLNQSKILNLNARNKALDHYDLKKVSRKYISLYKKILDS